jgi:hypothetical protein
MDYKDWDELSITARKYIAEKDAQIASLKEQLLKARTCEFCGSTDLVCGKGWQEEREQKLKEIASLKDRIKRIEGVLQRIKDGRIMNAIVDEGVDQSLSICREVTP